MEIYQDLSKPGVKEFENLLNGHLSKVKIVEGKLITGLVSKITPKFAFLFIENLKSEAIVDINEIKTHNLLDNLKVGSKLEVLLEKIEDRDGSVVVSLAKAKKLQGWEKILECYKKNEPINCKYVSRTKGGIIVSHIETNTLLFCPGSQLANKQMKDQDIGRLMSEPQKFAIVKVDEIRGNAVVSRRAIIESGKKESKAKLIEKYKKNQILENCVCKSITSFGAFFEIDNGALDTLCHLQELSYSRIESADQVLEVGKKYRLKIIGIDREKMQVSTSIKALSPDPFDNIDKKFEVGNDYFGIIKKVLEYGFFIELENSPGLSALCHQSEISYVNKNINPKTFAKINDRIKVRITNIDLAKRRIAVSHKLTIENPWEKLKKEVDIGSIIENSILVNKTEYALFVTMEKYPIQAFLHSNELDYFSSPEDAINLYKKGDNFEKLKVLEIDIENQKVRVSLREAISEDPFKFYDNYKEGDILTCKVVSSDDNKGISVQPENCKIISFIKRSQLATEPSNQRSSRWTKGDRLDCLLIKKSNRSVSLSIKALEEKLNSDALKKYGTSSATGKSLPFASLSDKIEKKKKSK